MAIIDLNAADKDLANKSLRQLDVRIDTNESLVLKVEGTDEEIALPEVAVKILKMALKVMARGDSVCLKPIKAELKTQQAAELLNISPT